MIKYLVLLGEIQVGLQVPTQLMNLCLRVDFCDSFSQKHWPQRKTIYFKVKTNYDLQ